MRPLETQVLRGRAVPQRAAMGADSCDRCSFRLSSGGGRHCHSSLYYGDSRRSACPAILSRFSLQPLYAHFFDWRAGHAETEPGVQR